MMRKIKILTVVILSLAVCVMLAGCLNIDAESAYDIAVRNGYVGSEKEWLESLKGDVVYEHSGYDVAVANGYQGTEQEWLYSLKGDKGDSGDVNITVSNGNEHLLSIHKALGSSLAIVSKIGSGLSSGSGVLYAVEGNVGYVVTNYHVVYDNKADTMASRVDIYEYGNAITSSNGTKARIVGGSMQYDLAVLAINMSNVHNVVAVQASLDTVTTGEGVYAVGNAESQGISVTSGIVSEDRHSLSIKSVDGNDTVVMSSIKVDAPINHGNSGGGLFNIEGELVGIVHAKSEAVDIEGMGYVIPMSIVDPIVGKIISADNGSDNMVTIGKYVLGIKTVAISGQGVYHADTGLLEIVEQVVIADKVDDMGNALGGVTAFSLAYHAGLRSGDVLMSARLGDRQIDITRNHHLGELLLYADADDTLELTYMRGAEQHAVNISFADAKLTNI